MNERSGLLSLYGGIFFDFLTTFATLIIFVLFFIIGIKNIENYI